MNPVEELLYLNERNAMLDVFVRSALDGVVIPTNRHPDLTVRGHASHNPDSMTLVLSYRDHEGPRRTMRCQAVWIGKNGTPTLEAFNSIVRRATLYLIGEYEAGRTSMVSEENLTAPRTLYTELP